MNRIFWTFILLIFVIACRNVSRTTTLTPNLVEKYLSEHSPSIISVKDPILLRFKYPITDQENFARKHLKIVPDIQGELTWMDNQTLQFTPAGPLPYNTKYVVKVATQAIDAQSEKETLVLPFSTRALEFAISLPSEVDYHKETASISGHIRSSDWVTEEHVENLLTLDRGTINWVHSQNGRNHHFSIENIKRTDAYQEYSIAWKDKLADASFSGEKTYAIAPIGLFEVVDIKTIPENNKIEVKFSDELDQRQSLQGFFKLNGKVQNLKYDRKGSVLAVYLDRTPQDEMVFTLNKKIKSATGKNLVESFESTLSLAPTKPELKLVGKGTITPYEDEILFPFEAKGLHAVDVEIVQIFANNVMQYLQNYEIDAVPYYLENVGRIVHQEVVNLSDLNQNPESHQWKRYAIDLQNKIDPDPGSLYLVRIGFRKNYTSYPCNEGVEEGPLEIKQPFETIMRWNSNYEGYRYRHESDPCYPVYYNSNRFIQRSILASNLGLLAKGTENNRYTIHTRNLKTLEPEAGVSLSIYDFQQQLLLEDLTTDQGKLIVETNRKPAFVIARKGKEYAYLSLKDQSSNSVSDFDISGSKKRGGVDGYIYGERGVWRPGDTMFISFMLEDMLKNLPLGYPIETRVIDSRGQLNYQNKQNITEGNIYVHTVATEKNDPTGNWRIQVQVGENVFAKALKVETVKPNRLKVDLDLPELVRLDSKKKIPFSSSWLFGVPAANLQSKIEATYSPVNTTFDGYNAYEFDDPARKITTVTNVIFDQFLDNQGKGELAFSVSPDFRPPGKLKVSLRTRVFEKTGEYSEDYTATIASPYGSYVGIKIPETSWGQKRMSKENDERVQIVALNEDGNPLANRKLSLGLYEAEWSWWYNRTSSNIYRYNQANHLEAVEKTSIITGPDGKVEWKPERLSGYRYMVRVCDDESGHCSGELFYTPYYSYESNDGAASILKLKTIKEEYTVGESIEFSVPSNLESKILVSVENGTGIIQDYWYNGQKNTTAINIPVSSEMAPNVYLHVTLIQEYGNSKSELPLRMYGVLPVKILDPETKIQPEIEMATVLEPKQRYEIKVSEQQSEKMYYTLAIVDEGLLGLTRYKTPDPHNTFYAKQALGVKTWDLYDQVLQGFGGEIDKYISIGGDAEISTIQSTQEANRFRPVVEYAGPFVLEAGKTNNHSFVMDNYLGAVRVMVVARNGRKYGSAEKIVPVKYPLMILPTAPRTLAPLEEFSLPINVFATENNIRQANLSLEVGPGLEIVGESGQLIKLAGMKEELASFQIRALDYQGPTFLKVVGKAQGKLVEQKIELSIENPNPLIYKTQEVVLSAGEAKTINYEKIGMPMTDEAHLTISTFPFMNLEKRLDYLIRYPYGCVEQTTSSIFPQLYLEKMISLNIADKTRIRENIQAGINRLAKFQLPSGGLAYWKGSREVSDWGTSYAGHFIIEAKEKGYFVPTDLLQKWMNYQQSEARSWTNPNKYSYEDMMQAYRLYVLAKAGEPEWGPMNILSSEDLSSTAANILAAAYTLAGQKSIGEEILSRQSTTKTSYETSGYTYGSDLRDQALVVEALISSSPENDDNTSAKVVEIAKRLGEDQWYSTQTTSFVLLAVGKYLSMFPSGSLQATVDYIGTKEEINSSASFYSKDLGEVTDRNFITVTNKSTGALYLTLTQSGKAPYGTTATIKENLTLLVTYKDTEGKTIDPTALSQGTDFLAEITVVNPGSRGFTLNEMALSMTVPSGWEIRNERMTGASENTVSDDYDYRDYRDNAVFTFFDLKKAKTFRVALTAAYTGKFYLPDIQCEAMYDHKFLARIPGKWVTVVPTNRVQ